jgi:hypothetical protein
MKLLYHATSWDVTPMFILDDNVDLITKHIWNTSTSVKDLPCEFHEFGNHQVCRLDPGGMYFMKTPHVQFEIDGYKFDIQISRIEQVLYLMNRAKERIPGYMRFPMWRWLMIFPKDVFERVKVKLEEMEKSDDAMHAELTEKEVFDSIYAQGVVVRKKKSK